MKLDLNPSPEFEKKFIKTSTHSGKKSKSLFAKKVDKGVTKEFWKAFEKVAK